MNVVEELIRLSRLLGDPAHDLAILAEGNASAVDGDTFWVKASGFQLASICDTGLIQVDLKRANGFLTGPNLSDSETKEALKLSRIDQTADLMPSVETFMHAYLLTLPDVSFVGHTHPTPLLSLLATDKAEWLSHKRIFPDEIVCCGP